MPTKVCLVKVMVFPVVMYGYKIICIRLYGKESWAQKNWCFWTVVLEKTPESPLDCKEIQPVYFKGDQSWVFIGRTDAEAEIQYYGHRMQRVDSFEKTLKLGKIGGRRRRGWQRVRWLDGITNLIAHELEQTLGVGDGQESLACCHPWDHKESDLPDRLNWTELDCSPPGSSVHGILQTRILEWVAISFSRKGLKLHLL